MTEDWKLQYPSTSVRRTYRGNKEYSNQFLGEANKLLYQLKNNMKFQKLGQLKMTRYFRDGTVITAMSHFGNDSVIIDVTHRVPGVINTCTITLYDLPDTVQPMKDPFFIMPGEVEGTDYIKTYYSLEVDCNLCEPIEWKLSFTYSDAEAEPNADIVGSRSIVQEDHCTYSLESCWAEIIEQGSDDDGTYIIWKAYTETSTYSRTGLGDMLFRALIKDKDVSILCFGADTVTVDCCNKDSALRHTHIYWEECEPEDPFISVGEVIVCQVPEVMSIADLDNYASSGKLFYVSPEDDGGCLPFTWSMSGPGSLDSVSPGLSADYLPPVGVHCSDIIISATDRCGTSDNFLATCCTDGYHNAMSITYTSANMGCDEDQLLWAGGGCPPYSWTLDDGGSLGEPYGSNNEYVVYTSPASNPDCEWEPKITLIDCCDESTTLEITANCKAGDIPAFKICNLEVWGVEECEIVGIPRCCGYFKVDNTQYYCDNRIHFTCYAESGYTSLCQHNAFECPSCSAEIALGYLDDFNILLGCGGCTCEGGSYWNCLWDQRDVNLLSEGCCPYNPETGEPL